MSEFEERFKKLIGKKVVISGDDAAKYPDKSKYLGKKGEITSWKPNPSSRIGGMIPIIKLEDGETVSDSHLWWTGQDEQK